MKKIFLLIFLVISSFSGFSQINISLSGYPLVTTGWNFGSSPAGPAAVVDSTMRLTNTTTGTASYCYYNTAINMTGWCQWVAEFDFKVVSSGGGVADGLAFWFLTTTPSTASTGSSIGLPANPNGMVLIFDTYNNNSAAGADNPLITLLGYNGSTASYTEGSATGQLAPVLTNQNFITDGNWHHVKVTYFLGNIRVYLNYGAVPSISTVTPYPLSITGYFGFSASTGAVVSTQSIKRVSIIVNDCLTPLNNGPVCQGDTLKLTALGDSTGATYSWYGPNGFTSTMQNPIRPNVSYLDSGDYFVIKTYGGVPDTESTHFSIKLNPVITAGSNSPVCVGGTISLTSGPTTTGQTFSWSGPNVFTSVLQNPTIAPASEVDTGFYTVIATLDGCTDTASTHVHVIHVTVPILSSNGPLCSGDNLQLFATDTLSGVTWAWSGPGGLSSTTQNPTFTAVTATNSGIYTLTATSGACSATNTLNVVVSTMPTIPYVLPQTRICAGGTIDLQIDPATLTPGAVYHWSGPNGFTSTITHPTIPNATTAASGLYSVYATNGSCSTTVAYNNFVVDPMPGAPLAWNNGPICSDSVLHLYATDTSTVTYYWHGPALFTSTMQNPTILNAQTNMSGNYTVTVTLGLCKDSVATNVLIKQTPYNPIVGSNAPICAGQLLNLTATFTPYVGVFHWTGPNGFTSLVQNPSILSVTTAATGIYTVYEILNNCSSDTVSFNVNILSTPSVPVATNNSAICEGDTLRLFATDDSVSTYLWTGPGGFTSTSQNTGMTNTPASAGGLYTVTAYMGTCSASVTTNVIITTTPSLTVTSNSPVCSGDTLKLFASSVPSNTFVWTGPYISTPLLGATPTRFPAIIEYSGVYYVTTSDAGGCTNTGSTTVIIKQTPLAPWITWLTFCQFDYAPPLQAVNASNVLWFPSSAGGVGTSTPPIPPTNVPGVYFYFLNQTVDGCVSPIDSIQVVVNPKPSVSVTPTDTSICPHGTIVYHSSVDNPLSTVRWLPTSFLSATTGLVTTAHPVSDIDYQVIATNMYNCTDTAFASVTVFPAALVSLNSGDSVTLYPGESYHISPITNGSTFTWFPPEGLDNPLVSDPTATPDVSTMYVVTAVTENGCVAKDSINFHVNDDNVYGIPNAFTPGTGANNEFKIMLDGVAKLNYFRIFNRWGVMVFETKTIGSGWDGTYKGEPQPFGVYVYDIQAVSSLTGKIKNMRGNVTLLR
ncbi:hypothetical protein CJD36_011260 [Flavipsychrobacter stenotrophus]|uniref:Immunoglobulin domain-containing protein n=1 Tax=Flavipsychrobacter stenotrophus TaxID=2077091 RepID=A0A2S7SVI5_9BACT|nr:gliding motility-associated C-terminal domain-containing protein [Flavipsychrobacter stenotrophus]PQJ10546.1 hypothetical protein CJD36_011260 [Flavipsychrobacter stenotrophus]